ncbi:MAG: DUF1543 domain-containing protein, partial [Bacteroidota bacterium]
GLPSESKQYGTTHDVSFGTGCNLKDLVPCIQTFWRETVAHIHIDVWRQFNCVDQYAVVVLEKSNTTRQATEKCIAFLTWAAIKKMNLKHFITGCWC